MAISFHYYYHHGELLYFMSFIGLGIETSCDETSVALVRDGCEVLANPVFSQFATHAKYQGIVPEMASRAHLEKLPLMLQNTLDGDHKIDYVAVTVRPGLVGCLLMGYHAALAVAMKFDVPLIPIHHLEAHIYAVQLVKPMPTYPFIGLLVSGGNSALYLINGLGKIEIIAETLDDACGEAFDKAAVALGLPYPGGPNIEKRANCFYQRSLEKKLSREKLAMSNPLPEILKDQKKNQFDFSFSGIKTALIYLLKKENYDSDALAYYFQERLIQLLLRNTARAISLYRETHKVSCVVAAGGVMANKTLRNALEIMLAKMKIHLMVPPIKFCTDNGAMVASLGANYFQKGSWPDVTNVSPSKGFLHT